MKKSQLTQSQKMAIAAGPGSMAERALAHQVSKQSILNWIKAAEALGLPVNPGVPASGRPRAQIHEVLILGDHQYDTALYPPLEPGATLIALVIRSSVH